MMHNVKPEPKDIFKVRYVREDDPGLFTKDGIYDACYGKQVDDKDGTERIAKRFGVLAEDHYWAYYENDMFEIVKDE